MRQSENLREYAAFARELAAAAAGVILPMFRSPMKIDDKAPNALFDPVTQADRDAETIMREMIADRYPEHGIEGEEHGLTQAEARLRWILDPIDGTKSFMTGVVSWGVLIGLLYDDAPILGLLHQPFLGESFLGFEGNATYLLQDETRRLQVRSCSHISQAILMTTSPQLFEQTAELPRFQNVENKVQMTRYGGDCYNYGLLAAGHIDLVIEAGLHRYDIAPLIPIIEAAGGIVTDWKGGNPLETGTVIAAGDAAIHAAAMDLIAAK
ncbi:MAG: histidinol-phosphatase [Fimbriimonadaceae bacterium]|nr:histidinol-phosphatase [Alphaproteobacteria bacterium]